MRRRRQLPSAAIIAFAVTWAPSPADAGGFHITILGARRTGMLTNIANPDDSTALFHNPAGLANQPGLRLHLSNGMTFMQTELELQALDPTRFPEINPPTCGTDGAPPCWPIGDDGYYEANIRPEKYLGVIPYLGVSRDLGWLAPGLKALVVSAAVYAPGAYGAYLPEDAPTAYYVMHGLFLVGSATAGLGWRLSPRLALGASVSYNYMRLSYAQKVSTLDLLTPDGESPSLAAGLAQAAVGDLRLDYTGVDHGVGGALGILVTPAPWLQLGAGVQAATSARLTGPMAVTGLGSVVTGTPPTDAADLKRVAHSFGMKLPKELVVEMPIPPALQAGLSVVPTTGLELGLDLRVWLYRLFQEQAMIPIYDAAEPGTEPLTRDNLSRDKQYHNSYAVALGARFSPWPGERDLDLMTGIAFDRSPVPDKTFSIDSPSLDQLMIGVGVRGTIFERWRLGVGYLLNNWITRNVTDSITSPPTNVRLRGRAHIPTVEVEYIDAPPPVAVAPAAPARPAPGLAGQVLRRYTPDAASGSAAPR